MTDSAIAASTGYVEGYLEYIESLPDDMQRSLSQMRELDLHYQDRLKEIERLLHSYNRDKDPISRRKWLIQIQRRLVKSQEYGDEKLQLVAHMVDVIDNKSRQIEVDMENLDTFRNDDTQFAQLVKQESSSMPTDEIVPPTKSEKTKRNRRQRNNDKADLDTVGSVSTGGGDQQKPVKKKAKTSRKKKTQDSPTHNIPIDPNEPTYCLCNQVSFGEMIGCDNEECQIEWFHFQCVGLSHKPKGKWYCPRCMQERKKERNYIR
ncbi:predicted protein [Nematostella vectensis]|uniref:Inhibitor of growth protein n=1 Tax=Nematostella vectensis TaxID=45351 RepID=A7RXJ4_NEMVE|nr:predicted protein [Nematostella vectensis]|eukprot:XP_001635920.1 predicted protein [Nematostella vectensis]